MRGSIYVHTRMFIRKMKIENLMYIYMYIESECIVIKFKITTDHIKCINHYAVDNIK